MGEWLARRLGRAWSRSATRRPAQLAGQHNSQARAAISYHSWFCAKPLSDRFRSPVSLAQRIRSSHRDRQFNRLDLAEQRSRGETARLVDGSSRAA
jgi:hypothetical protein